MDDVRFILNRLNAKPFNKNLNIISYDNLRPDQRIEILIEIIKQIDPTTELVSLSAYDPEEFIIQILDYLRIFKYRQDNLVNASLFRQNILNGEKNTYTNVYYFLLKHEQDLQKRAYLAKYLIKIEISPDLEGDNDIMQLYSQYEQAIENFKSVHSMHEALKENVDSFQELQKDIKSMEIEQDQLDEKLSNLQRKPYVDSNPTLMQQIKLLNAERTKYERMQSQQQNTENEIEKLRLKCQQLNSEQKDIENVYFADQQDQSSELFVNRLEEEVNAKQHLIDDILLDQINLLTEYVQDLQQLDVHAQNGDDNQYLNRLQFKIENLTAQINQELSNKMLMSDQHSSNQSKTDSDEMEKNDNKFNFFKQNASILNKKKNSLEAELKDLETLKTQLYQQFSDKQRQHGDHISLHEYRNQMRELSAEYLEKKQKLSEMQELTQQLNDALESFKSELEQMNNSLIDIENKQGLQGYFSSQMHSEDQQKAWKTDLNQNDNQTDDLFNRIKQLNESIEEHKTHLNYLVQEQVKPLRLQHMELKRKYDQQKSGYDAVAVGLETRLGELKKTNASIEQSIKSNESQYFGLDCQSQMMQTQLKWLQNNPNIERELGTEIEQEVNRESDVQQRLEHLRLNKQNGRKQNQMWSDLITLLTTKFECMLDENQRALEQQQHPSDQSVSQIKDHLVL